MTAFRDAVVFLLEVAAGSRHGDIATEQTAQQHLSDIAAELKERDLPMPSGDPEPVAQAPLPGSPTLPVQPPPTTAEVSAYVKGVVDELKK